MGYNKYLKYGMKKYILTQRKLVFSKVYEITICTPNFYRKKTIFIALYINDLLMIGNCVKKHDQI